ncbi:NEDD4 family-interacting protein 2-like isoform X1 [Centruroides sculpturatus]|uniref:NEDD4 family-interacting protein 2-like isoform X1 n=1 Tax=Centruroides sculpturatus TaxID=218467 RepID=UPI000C6D4A64|nr:NEDD4 family-interacting protein 2-like isoform X1 [Centruroides sculpturatus]
MDRPVRYQTLQQEEEPVPPQGIPPPEYEDASGAAVASHSDNANMDQQASASYNSDNGDTSRKCQGYFPSPPPYSVAAAELPTYEEAQRSKMLEEEERQHHQEATALFSRDEDILGTDFLFFMSFFVAFLFNWVGFLLLLCFCHTLAGRYGALAGFGLSLTKWTLIVKHSTDLITTENEWLWWIIMAFGVLICARACLQYIHAKREWRLLNPIHRERLFFFY